MFGEEIEEGISIVRSYRVSNQGLSRERICFEIRTYRMEQSRHKLLLPTNIYSSKHKQAWKNKEALGAAAMVNGVSLNTVLLKGPDLNMPLPGVLQRFRHYKITVSGDLKEMFHQIQQTISAI